MPFIDKPQVFSASVNALKLGTEGREVTIGGGKTFPLYTFDAPAENVTKIGIEISDKGVDTTLPGLAAYYEGCTTIPEIAARAAKAEGADFVVLSLESADPNGDNAPIADCVETVKAVYDAIDKPLAVLGSKNIEKDTELLQAVAEALREKNILLLSCREENYKAIGVGAVLANHQNIAGESAVDINLAKQLNVLLSQMGVPSEKVAMNCGSAAAGYGYEYLVSTIERVKSAALAQNDVMLQMPIISMVGDDCWSVKEALLEESENPVWGDREERGIQMEIITASGLVASGADALIMRHPEAIKTIAAMIAGLK